MIRTTSLALLLAGLVACGQSNEFEISSLNGHSDAQIAEAEESAWQAMSEDGVLDGVEEVDVLRTQFDEVGVAHVRYQQYAGGFPVFGGEVIAHVNQRGEVTGYTDSLIRDLRVETGIEYNQADAKDIALSLDARGLQPSEEQTAELVVLVHEGRAYLVWKVRTAFLEAEPGIPTRFIDAKSGELIWEYDDLKTAALSDSDKVTYDMGNSTRTNRATVGDSSDAELLMTHDSIGQALSFLSTYGIDSYDNNGAVVRSYGHYSRSYVNAYWDGSRLVFGDGDNVYSTYLGVLDVAGHELAHAVTDYIGPSLTYAYESGALNEGASDIFAAALEAYVDGGTGQDTWDIGEDCWLQGRALRYMQYPSNDGSSTDHYAARYTGSQDSGGVHWNSGIANHWFYLLVEGGQHHTAAYRSGRTVQGIGMDAAYHIFLNALANYMTASTNFSGARTATESSCSALGYSADTCHSVSVAWYEVGVGSDPGDYGGGGGGGTDTGGGGGTDTGGGGGTDTGGGGGTDTGSGGGTTVTCPTGWGSVTGSLANGASDVYTYSTSGRGYHEFELYGPSSADFDLYLRKNGSTVASSTSASSEESITYYDSRRNGSSFEVEVDSYSGSGSYTLCYSF